MCVNYLCTVPGQLCVKLVFIWSLSFFFFSLQVMFQSHTALGGNFKQNICIVNIEMGIITYWEMIVCTMPAESSWQDLEKTLPHDGNSSHW